MKRYERERLREQLQASNEALLADIAARELANIENYCPENPPTPAPEDDAPIVCKDEPPEVIRKEMPTSVAAGTALACLPDDDDAVDPEHAVMLNAIVDHFEPQLISLREELAEMRGRLDTLTTLLSSGGSKPRKRKTP
jgi:hypothetical protein